MEQETSNNLKPSRDWREAIFFVALGVIIYIKFYCLELAVSSIATRYPASAAASAGIVLMLLALVSLCWHVLRPYIAILLDFLMSALALTDIFYMRYYSDLFTVGNLGLGAQVGEISESVAALFSPLDPLYLIDIPLLLLYLFFVRRRGESPVFKKLTARRVCLTVLIVALGASMLAWRIVSYQKKVPGVMRSMWDRPAVCNNIGALTYHAVDGWNVATDLWARGHVKDEEVNEITQWFSGRNGEEWKPARLFGAAKGKNLIVIQVESLQQFVVGLELNGAEVTPNLNKFIHESVYFSRVYNQTGSGNSSDAEFLVNTGLYPSPSGVAYTRFAGNTYKALPGLLAQNGYSTIALHGDRPGFWNRQRMYPALGFQRFVSKLDFVVDENIGMGLSDKSFFRQSLEILAKGPRPFYAFLITLTSHYPYNFSQIEAQTKFDVSPFTGQLMGNYLRSMKYFDTQFGMFIDGLKKKGLYDESVIVVYGDHTAIPKWDSANLEKLLGRSFSDEWRWREVLRVPLAVRIPGRSVRPRRDAATAAGLVNVSDTVAALLGFRFPFGFGRDLFSLEEDEPVIFRNGSYVLGSTFVEPSASLATDVRTGKKLDFDKFSATTDEVKRRLAYSDRVLEHDLVPKIQHKREAAK